MRIKYAIAGIVLILALGLFISHPTKIQAGPDGASAGAEVHKAHCQKCHGPEGKGDGPAAKLLKPKPADWTDREKMSKITDDDLIKIIKDGGESAGKSKLMPAFKEKLNDGEIRQAAAFVRSLSQKKK